MTLINHLWRKLLFCKSVKGKLNESRFLFFYVLHFVYFQQLLYSAKKKSPTLPSLTLLIQNVDECNFTDLP